MTGSSSNVCMEETRQTVKFQIYFLLIQFISAQPNLWLDWETIHVIVVAVFEWKSKQSISSWKNTHKKNFISLLRDGKVNKKFWVSLERACRRLAERAARKQCTLNSWVHVKLGHPNKTPFSSPSHPLSEKALPATLISLTELFFSLLNCKIMMGFQCTKLILAENDKVKCATLYPSQKVNSGISTTIYDRL